jgi:hypothetical protein
MYRSRFRRLLGAPAVALRYRPGDPLPSGAVFTGEAAKRTYIDAAGLLQTVASANVPRDAHYIAGRRTLLLECLARTNVVIRNRDLTDAAWVKSASMAALKDQMGPDGVANSASRITASAATQTCLQAITLGSSARYQSAWVKRLVGAGVIEMTMDNGVTWTAIAPTGAWTRCTIPTQTLANPTVGFRINTSGDSIAVDYVQNEDGVYPSSAIATAAAAVTRTAEVFTIPIMFPPQALNLFARGFNLGTAGDAGASMRWVELGTGTGRLPHSLGRRWAIASRRLHQRWRHVELRTHHWRRRVQRSARRARGDPLGRLRADRRIGEWRR